MWPVVVCTPLLPAALLFSPRWRLQLAALWQGARTLALRLLRGRVCIRRAHAFVFTRCTHGDAESVLETFDLLADTHLSDFISPAAGWVLDEAVKRVRPTRVLVLGTRCGYSAVRLLRLLPPGGWLVAVEPDPLAAELAEEIVMVAGFKHPQFRVLTSSCGEAVPTLHSLLVPEPPTREGLHVVLMDQDPRRFLPDLQALESAGLLCHSGCSLLLLTRDSTHKIPRELSDYIQTRPGAFCTETESGGVLELTYRRKGKEPELSNSVF